MAIFPNDTSYIYFMYRYYVKEISYLKIEGSGSFILRNYKMTEFLWHNLFNF